MSQELKFNGRGLKTTAGARGRLHLIAHLLDERCRAFVAEQNGMFYPVVMLSEATQHCFAIASLGVTVVRV
jgi:hypothetical protein